MTNVLGSDISVWDDDGSTPQHVDFVKMKNKGAKFVYIKSSQANWADRDIFINWQNAKNAGIDRGAYHFMTWDIKPEEQAKFFVGLLKNDLGELPLCCDFEWWKTTPSNAKEILWAFMVQLEKETGRKEMIYTASSYWKQYGSTAKEWGQYKLWLAWYNASEPICPAPWTRWTLWQYTDRGPGLDYGVEAKDLDMNWYNGTLYDYNKEFDLDSSVTTPVVTTPPTTPIVLAPKILKYKTNKTMRIRSGPSLGASVIGSLPIGIEVTPLEIGGSDSWIMIDNNKWIANTVGGVDYLDKEI